MLFALIALICVGTAVSVASTANKRIDLIGEGYHIYVPYHQNQKARSKRPLVSSSEIWIEALTERFERLDKITVLPKDDIVLSVEERARIGYINFIASFVSGRVYGDSELSVTPGLGVQRSQTTHFNESLRSIGMDWTYLGYTMVGSARIRNLVTLLKDVFKNNIPGGFMETGVWRGGASILARAVMHAYNQTHRTSYVCDSFAGLPPGIAKFSKGDVGWDHTSYLEVDDIFVRNNFVESHLLDQNVVFGKGFFNNTMPIMRPIVTELSILRLDGDIYQSTVDVLYHMYDKLAVGGYVIVDDWTGFPAKLACEDFFKVHRINPKVVLIDTLAAYWQKTEKVTLQFWRYKQMKFRDGSNRL